jgi:hypothetical protein
LGANKTLSRFGGRGIQDWTKWPLKDTAIKMGKERKRETILKTDPRNLYLELGLQGKFAIKSSGWDENRVLLEGDVLEVAVVKGRWVITHVPAKPKVSSTPLVENYFPTG